jgi:hypothetical protein
MGHPCKASGSGKACPIVWNSRNGLSASGMCAPAQCGPGPRSAHLDAKKTQAGDCVIVAILMC